MALIGNYTLLNRTSIRTFAGTATSMTAFNYSPPASLRNRLSAYGQKSGTPYGYLAPVSWVLPNAGGAMSSYNPAILNLGQANATLIPARNLEASGTTALVVTNAQLDQIVSLIANALLVLTNNNAQLAAAAASSADGVFALAVNNALCGAIFSVTTSGTLQLNQNATLTALASMEVDYIPGSGGSFATSAELNSVKEELLAEIAKTLTTKKFIALNE